MLFKLKSKASAYVTIALLSFMILMVCGMAMLGGAFFSYAGKAFHYVYHFLFVRPFDYVTVLMIVVLLVVIGLFVYWMVNVAKSESLRLYELLAPLTCILLPFSLLAAYKAIGLKVWASSPTLLVIITLLALVIYVASAVASLVYAFKVTRAKRIRMAKEKHEVKVEVVEAKEEKVEEPKETVKVVEKVVYVEKEPVKEEKPAEPVVEAAPVTNKKKIVRKPFAEKMAKASGDIKETYNELKNELLSYGVKSRISHGSDTFRLRKQEYAKITLVGKNLKLYVATDPKKYEGTTFPVRDESAKKCFAETPTMIKVKSTLSVKRAKMMIADLMAERNLPQGEVEKVDYAKQLKAKKARVAKK